MPQLLLLMVVLLAVLAIAVIWRFHPAQMSLMKKDSQLNEALARLVSSEQMVNKLQGELMHAARSDTLSGKILTHLPLACFFCDEQGQVLYLNPTAEIISQSPKENFISHKLDDTLPLKNSDKSASLKLFNEVAQGQKQVLIDDAWLVTPNGTVSVSVRMTAIREDAALKGGILLLYENIGKSAQEEDAKAFTAQAAHELRTPLTIITSTISMIKENRDKLPPAQQDELFEGVTDAAEKLTTLVNDIIDISRLERGKLEVKQETFDLIELSKKVVKNFEQMAAQKKLFLHHDVESYALPKVHADKARVEEILTNLISNALKYTFQGSVTVTHTTENHHVITLVTDTGVGIPEREKSLLFHKFQQVGEARKLGTEKSTGLGLYIAQKLAQRMGGDITIVESEPGKGSTFKLTLPAVTSA